MMYSYKKEYSVLIVYELIEEGLLGILLINL